METKGRKARAGVIGTGRLGREHARVYASLDEVGTVRLYDQDAARAAAIAAERGGTPCATIEELLSGCDLVSICTPATHHHAAAAAAFEAGVHVLVEKPIASDTAAARDMIARARSRGCVLQVGHIERFNGAFEAARGLLRHPRFIESHRLATFTPRGLDVSVVQDLMIHDIDLILTVLAGDSIAELRASGAGVLTGAPDIVNARIEFAGGCVANVTASRISREPLRKIRFFEENRYVSVDLRDRSVEAFEKAASPLPLVGSVDPERFIHRIGVEVDGTEPLRKEIISFLAAVRGEAAPAVTAEEGLEALRVAERVLECVTRAWSPR
ncbi:MAG TPA: Gfo/Idh/MocA family oxidoreductase [Candidatus Bathyarchaeia archaeon]|nr:Gfo/Idh/MocA family oxidoreductase [Candidatus Bathyarchaeia archaeon]